MSKLTGTGRKSRLLGPPLSRSNRQSYCLVRCTHPTKTIVNRKRILYITTRVPYPPNRGDRIRSYHTLRFLAARASVSLATLADEAWTDEQESELRKHCEQLAIVPHMGKAKWGRAVASLGLGRSATEGLFSSRELSKVVTQWAQEQPFDCVVAFCTSMFQFTRLPSLEKAPCFVDFVDVDSLKWKQYAERSSGIKRMLYGLEHRRNRTLEKRIVAVSKGNYLVSENEASILRDFAPGPNTRGIGNGVDLDFFAPQETTENVEPETCVFVGGMDYQPNIDGVCWFAEHVWPALRERHSNFQFVIVGRDPTDEVKALEGKYPGIQVTGAVDDVRPFVANSRFVVAPLRIARGIQNKVLEAMAMGKAVLSSPEALTGIDLTPGTHAVEATTPEQWVEFATDLLGDADRRTELGVAAREFVERHHSWEAQLLPLESELDL